VSTSIGAVVRLRLYAGLSVEETAQAMGVSTRTVQREWSYARAWLARKLGRELGVTEQCLINNPWAMIR
jgi:DNA-directed RNA polymerase specialized sigma24 family protein